MSGEQLQLPNGAVEVDPQSGGLAALHLTEPETSFVARPSTAGLLRFALPLSHFPSHHVEVGTHGAPTIERRDDTLTLTYETLTTSEGTFPVRVEITLMAAPDGLRLRARVHNGGSDVIPQVCFPQLLGLGAIDGAEETRIQLSRGQVWPLLELTARPDDARFLQIHLQRYIPRGSGIHNMKWLDYGSSQRGFSLYREETRDVTQGLLVDRPDRMDDQINLSWVHFPFIQPGETWDSGEFVLLPHAGDWFAGARAYQSYAAQHYPYNAPKRLREALGVRSMWAAVRSTPPTFPLSEIPEYAAELKDLDLAELIIWHWWLKNGYPIFLDPRLGTEAQFKDALDRCRAAGVPVSLFVSHHLVRDTDESDPSWFYRNAAQQHLLSNWTYGPGYTPRFGPTFIGTHSMVWGTALSPGWRETGLSEYRKIQEKYGPVSICFDVFVASAAPDFNPDADGRPDEEGEKLLEFAREARALIAEANRETNPEATFSGEFTADTKQSYLDYTWEWKNGSDMEASAPFRYVFPHFRLNANVNEHPRGALIAFMEGALLNVMPGNMHSWRLRDCPELVAMLKKLAALRKRYLRYFTEGQFRFTEGLTVRGGVARVYTHGEDVLVIAINPTDAPADVTVAVDPSVWDGEGARFEESFRLGPDDLRIVERTR